MGGAVKRARALALALAALLAPTGRAHARGRGVDLSVRRLPAPARAPATLAMRGESASEPPRPRPARPASGSLIDRFVAIPSELEELSDKVVFHFQLGQDLEQGQLSGQPMGSGQPLPADNRNTRFFTIGDLALGSHGLPFTPLSTYLAAHFRFDQDGSPTTSSAPSVYDAAPQSSALLVRSAYAELGDVAEGWLAPLRVRAGRQFRYGMGVAHFDGVSAWYELPSVSASAFLGRRVSLFHEDLLAQGLAPGAPAPLNGSIAGISVDVRLARHGDAALVVGTEVMRWDGHDFGQGTLRLQLTSDAALSSYIRLGDGRLARWGAGVRARLSRTTTFSLDGEHRLADDWAYDLVVRARNPSDAGFLFLGPAVPELRLAGRAGTVLLDNLDLLLSVAGALPVGGVASPWAAPYAEVGVAVDGRLASGLSLALSLRARGYFRPRPDAEAAEVLRFGDVASTGERAIYDGGVRIRYAAGRKRFAAEFELFFREVSDRHIERPINTRLPYERVKVFDPQGGTRFRVESWIGSRARVLAEYEVSSAPAEITEFLGLQSLRLVGEVSF